MEKQRWCTAKRNFYMILPHEKNIRELQKVLNERYILLEEKQSINEHEYVFLGRALGYIFSFKKKNMLIFITKFILKFIIVNIDNDFLVHIN